MPTFAQAGYGGIKAFTAFSVMAPAKVPPTVVQRLSAEIAKGLKLPANAAKLDQLALLPVFDAPAQFAASLKEEQQVWAAFIKQQGITPD